MERVRSKNPYTNSFTRNQLWNFRLMVLKTSALIYGFLLHLNPVKVQCYRITHVHNYYSISSTTILWKILSLIFLDILNQILWGILSGSASRVNWDKLTVIEIVQDIESVSQRDWFICHIFWVCRAWNYHVINISDLFIWLVWKLERSLHKSISWWLRPVQVFSDW